MLINPPIASRATEVVVGYVTVSCAPKLPPYELSTSHRRRKIADWWGSRLRLWRVTGR